MKIKILHEWARIPQRAHPHDAGADLFVPENYTNIILSGARETIPLGISIEVPKGWVGLVCPRSGLAAHHGVTVLNSPGIIDYGYTGEIQVILQNNGVVPYVVEPLSRIAQLVLQEIKTPFWDVVTKLEDTQRGMAGLGSTGS